MSFSVYLSYCELISIMLDQFEDPTAYKDKVVATGLPASPGAAVGQIVFSADDAESWHAQGKSAILVKLLYVISTTLSLSKLTT